MKDDVKLFFAGGDGGMGAVNFGPNHYPTGGNGGKGGDLYLECRRTIDDLSAFQSGITLKAQNGVHGGLKNLTGKDGEDLVLLVPPTTDIIDDQNQVIRSLAREGERHLLARGGAGGLGNHYFKSKGKAFAFKSTPAQNGEHKSIRLLYKMRADIALIGLPNAGKSSLLVALTNSRSKIAPYAFTTLTPERGVGKNLRVLVDFPGIISGFTKGKGMGKKYLHHLENIPQYWLCVSLEAVSVLDTCRSLLAELRDLPLDFSQKQIRILLTKADLLDSESTVKMIEQIRTELKIDCISVSILDDESLAKLQV